MFLRNVCIFLHVQTALQPSRPTLNIHRRKNRRSLKLDSENDCSSTNIMRTNFSRKPEEREQLGDQGVDGKVTLS
jgi:hypothetical protein